MPGFSTQHAECLRVSNSIHREEIRDSRDVFGVDSTLSGEDVMRNCRAVNLTLFCVCVAVLCFPSTAVSVTGGQTTHMPSCNVAAMTSVNCNLAVSTCTGTFQVCDGCSPGTSGQQTIGACYWLPINQQNPSTCFGQGCGTIHNSAVQLFSSAGQVCVPTTCP